MTKKVIALKIDCVISCGSCFYYKQDGEEEDGGYGRCRRYPPVLHPADDGGFTHEFPQVNEEDYCGEFGVKN